jgi:hypothetical protein
MFVYTNIPVATNANANVSALFTYHLRRARFFRAALAPSFPRAVRVFFDRCATVFFRRAALAAFFMFRFAAARCFLVVIFSPKGSLLVASFSHLPPYLRLDAESGRSCRKNRLTREIRSLVQLPLVAQPDRAERQIQMFQLPLPETLME